MSESMPIPWEETRATLMQSEPAFYKLEPGGSLALSLGDEAWMLELTPDGRLICQTGMDMDDIQSLLCYRNTRRIWAPMNWRSKRSTICSRPSRNIGRSSTLGLKKTRK